MADYTQADRAFRVDTPLDEDELLLEAFSGEERISAPFRYTLELLSENDAIEPTDLLEQALRISLRLADGSNRYFHGHVSRFLQFGKEDDLTSYRAQMVPWLWFLSLSRDSRVFQEMSVLEIVEQIFGEYTGAEYRINCVRSYAPREYCVQYRETDLNFVSRLLEEEGIYYYFEHAEDGHTLTLVDDQSMIEPCPVQSEFRLATTERSWLEEDVFVELEREHLVNSRRVTLRDYDYEQPRNDLEATRGSDEGGEIYDYPGGYTELSQGEEYARLLLEERGADQEVVRGGGTSRTLATGYGFDLVDYYVSAANQSYLVVSVRHQARGGGYRSGRPETTYRNHFEAIPTSVPYRPPRRAFKPRVQGSQTAVVVGPSGEEVHTDDLGRIKVQFHWDRLGGMDENSSCWVRVATPWGGKGYGSVSTPRIGNEVVVQFLEGDPDRPLVVASVYNADQTPPHGEIEMGMKSRSSPGGGGYNQITMSDTKGEEAVTVHAQYDMSTTVGNDETHDVGNNRTSSVAVDETMSVGSNQSLEVGADRSVTVGAGNTVDVGADHALTAGGEVSSQSGAGTSIQAGADASVAAAANISLQAGAQIQATAGSSITLTAGGSSIEIGPGGVKITTGAMVEIKAAMIKHNA